MTSRSPTAHVVSVYYPAAGIRQYRHGDVVAACKGFHFLGIVVRDPDNCPAGGFNFLYILLDLNHLKFTIRTPFGGPEEYQCNRPFFQKRIKCDRIVVLVLQGEGWRLFPNFQISFQGLGESRQAGKGGKENCRQQRNVPPGIGFIPGCPQSVHIGSIYGLLICGRHKTEETGHLVGVDYDLIRIRGQIDIGPRAAREMIRFLQNCHAGP